MRLFTIFSSHISNCNKREMLSYLKAMPSQQIDAHGFSRVLMERGISAWPWNEDNRKNELNKVKKMIAEEKKNESELQAYTDPELHDLGLSRGLIDHAVRHGREGIDAAVIEKAA